jgi:hypothetical protein
MDFENEMKRSGRPEPMDNTAFNARDTPYLHAMEQIRNQDYPQEIIKILDAMLDDRRGFTYTTLVNLDVILKFVESQAILFANHSEFDTMHINSNFKKELAKFKMCCPRSDRQRGEFRRMLRFVEMFHESKMTRPNKGKEFGAAFNPYPYQQEEDDKEPTDMPGGSILDGVRNTLDGVRRGGKKQ